MSAGESSGWQEANQRYLAAALGWLRLRLGWQTSRHQPLLVPALAGEPDPSPHRHGLFGWSAPAHEAAPDAEPPPHSALETVSDKEVAKAAEAMNAAEAQAQPPPALAILAERLGLSRFERDVLLLCAAMELDTRIAALCARAQDDPQRAYPTFALALTLFGDPAWDVLSPQRPLRFWRLLEINQPGAQPLTTSALRADERVVNYVKGLNYLDDRLAPLLVGLPAGLGAAELPASQHATADAIIRTLTRAYTDARLPVVQLLGVDAPSKQLLAAQVAAALGVRIYRLPSGLVPTQAGEIETLARLWQRESILLPVALYIDSQDGDVGASTEAQASSVRRFLARTNGLLFLDSRDIIADLGAATVAFDIAKPTAQEQRAAWTTALGVATETSPTLLAAQFDLSIPAIQQISRAALAEKPNGAPPTAEALWGACLIYTRPRLEALAHRLDAKATWDSIVLPPDETELLHTICDQVRQRRMVYEEWGFGQRLNRGLGISVLFAGESGTGKTMGAEVIANDLRLNLYRIDLSAVVSKYIGETEKNLRRLFDAAEDGGAILFFDEADALFGKRSEVKDSHDRYANIEINYLLQRIETYRGLAILATNMKNALDPAFMRRLRFIVNFSYPGVVERRAIWQKVFPPQTPTANLDLDRLARLNVTGGIIHNIALNAAFLAARAGTGVTMALVLNAARTEFLKAGLPIRESEFRSLEPAGGTA